MPADPGKFPLKLLQVQLRGGGAHFLKHINHTGLRNEVGSPVNIMAP